MTFIFREIQNKNGAVSNSKLSPSSSTSSERPRVISPVIGSAPKPAPGTPLMTRQQYFNPLDSDDDEELKQMFIKPPAPPPRNPSPVKNSAPTINRAASSPKTKIRVIKPQLTQNASSISASVPEVTILGSSAPQNDQSNFNAQSLILPAVTELPAAESQISPGKSKQENLSPKPASSEPNLDLKRKPSIPKLVKQTHSNASSSGSSSRLRDVLSSRPVLSFPADIEHVPLPPSSEMRNGNNEVNGTKDSEESDLANVRKLRSGVSMLIDAEPGEQDTLSRHLAGVQREIAEIQNLLQSGLFVIVFFYNHSLRNLSPLSLRNEKSPS